jgi:RNA polymerase sigma-70 factor (ECF subfamily)
MEVQRDQPGAAAIEALSLTDESSVVLLREAQQGDRRALDELCSRYLPRLRRWAHGRLPGHARDLLDTDDLVQESLLRTLRRLGSLHAPHGASLNAYFHKAIINQIRRQVERARRNASLGESNDAEPSPAPSPLDVTIGREAVARYETALAALRAEDRELIIMRVELGCRYRELACILGRPSPDAARVAVARALTRLGKEMANGRTVRQS